MSSDDHDPAGPSEAGGVVPSPAEQVAADGDKSRTGLPVWQESLLLLALAVVLAVLLKSFVVQAFYIPSESMEPGLVEDDRILVEKWSGWFGGEVERGDVVVFEDPGGWLSRGAVDGPANPVSGALTAIGLLPDTGFLVKRVVGVEGDTIVCCDDQKRLVVNGVALVEDDYVLKGKRGRRCRGPMVGDCEWEAGPVPEGSIFVMGDNRGRSADSTVHMCLEDETECVPGDEFVPTDLVVGKVWLLLWPADRFGGLEGTDAFDDVPDAS